MRSIERRIKALEQAQPHTNGHPHRSTYWSEDDLFACLRHGDLRFEGAGNVTVCQSIGKTTEYYDFLADLAVEMNLIYSQGRPGAILVPLTKEQVDAAQVALAAGDFTVWMSSDYGPCRTSYLGIGPRRGAAPEVAQLAKVVSGALRCFIDQLPPDQCKEVFQSLEGLRWMLDWCRKTFLSSFNEVNDGDDWAETI